VRSCAIAVIGGLVSSLVLGLVRARNRRLNVNFANGATVTFGGELGGIGSNTSLWTGRARVRLPF